MTTTIRTATVNSPGEFRSFSPPTLSGVRAYLPSNYQAVAQDDGSILIVGVDRAGWTLADYVIPRLASGLIRAVEGPSIEVPTITITLRRGRVAEATARVGGVEVPVAATVVDRDDLTLDIDGYEIVDAPRTYPVPW